MDSPQNFKNRTCDPAILLLSIYPKKGKPGYQETSIHSSSYQMIWKQPKYSPTNETIRKTVK